MSFGELKEVLMTNKGTMLCVHDDLMIHYHKHEVKRIYEAIKQEKSEKRT